MFHYFCGYGNDNIRIQQKIWRECAIYATAYTWKKDCTAYG